MKTPFENKIHVLRTLGLALSLGSLPLAFSMTGCASSDHRPVVTERNADLDINRRVIEALENNSRHRQFADVRVETRNSAVTLTGYVNSEEQKLRAGEIARNVPGVTEVFNRIVVRSGS